MNKSALLIQLWKKAQAEGELTFPCKTYGDMYRIRSALYDVCKKVMKDPNLDPELFAARTNTQIFSSKKTDETHFITLRHMSADPLMQELAGMLGMDIKASRTVAPGELLSTLPVEELSESDLDKAFKDLEDPNA